MLEDRHFLWNGSEGVRDMIPRVQNVIDRSPALSGLPRGLGLATGLVRVCYERGIHPTWLLVSLQREQGLLAKEQLTRDWELEAACGVVGQDGPGTSVPHFMGLFTQLYICAKSAAWSANIGADETFRPRPSWDRWGQGQMVKLYDDPPFFYQARTMAEYAQLVYTPHLSVLKTNWRIYTEFVEPHLG